MKKCCCIILAACFALAFVTTTLATDVVLEFYLQVGDSPVVPIKNLHCMVIDSDKNQILNEYFEDEVVCKVVAPLNEGEYSLFVEALDSQNLKKVGLYENATFSVSSQQSSSMIFLFKNSTLELLEGVHSCDENLACTYGEECVCDDECICKRIHSQDPLKLVGQKKEVFPLSTEQFSTANVEHNVERRYVVGQPTFSASCACSNLYNGACNPYLGGVPCYSAAAGGGVWGALGALGLLGVIRCPKPGPVTEESVYE